MVYGENTEALKRLLTFEIAKQLLKSNQFGM